LAIRVLSTVMHVLNMRTRIPFRFGISTMTAAPHLFLRAEVEVDGRRHVGVAADHLPPKWFTKNPDTPYRDDVAEMLRVIETACDVARAAPTAETVFDFWWSVYQGMSAWGGGWDKPPLLTHFGTSLVERAVIDAFCRAEGTSFAKAVRRNWLGVDLGRLQPELEGKQPADLLPAEPLRSIVARHTVGLTDALTDADIPPADRVNDGLPQSLEASIRAYGLTQFKIKLCGDLARDLDRLRKTAAVLDREVPGGRYAHTLDGNENFKEVAPFRQLWERLASEPSLHAFMSRLIFVEQPLLRSVALSDAVAAELSRWAGRPPIIIDESDGEIRTAREALSRGYVGTSHKNCKGVFKGLANACLIAHRNRANPGQRFLISGEDLSNVGPVALLQDLAAVATLGIESVERNGQHYFRGLSMVPHDVQEAVADAHPDLYRRLDDGTAAPRIEQGRMSVGSVVDAPFGIGFDLNTTRFTPANRWDFATLGLS
jgi:hypothetical protein